MNKFSLTVVNANAKDLQIAYGVTDARLAELQGKINTALREQRGTGVLDTSQVLNQVVPECQSLEEVVLTSYAIGCHFYKEQQKQNPLAQLAALLG